MVRNFVLSIILLVAAFPATSAAPPPGTLSAQGKETAGRNIYKDEVMPLFMEIGSVMQPRFQDRAMSAFKYWVLHNLRFPAEGFTAGETGNVMMSFTVSKNGKLKNIVIVPGSDKRFAPYVKAQIAKSPAWTAAVRENEFVESKHMLGFDIVLKSVDGIAEFCSEDNTAYDEVDTMPVFGSGEAETFDRWVKERVEKHFGGDTAVLKGTVPLEFVVEKDGSVAEIMVGETPNIELARITGNVASVAPAWTPGIFFGEKVRVGMHVPIYFGDSPEPDANAIYELADMMPQFYGGGLELFRSWVQKHVLYPDKALRNNIKGRVTAMFVIEKDGSISTIQILESPHQYLSDEVVRALQSAPKWVPGVSEGKTVRVRYTLPIDFKFREEPAPQVEYVRPRSSFAVPNNPPARRY